MIADTPRDGDKITEEGVPTLSFFSFLTTVSELINRPTSYQVAGVPDPAKNESKLIYVSDESGGKTIAFSDGINWLRCYDRAIIS